MKINEKRLHDNLFELAKIGKNVNGGIDRALGDETDGQARQWLTVYWNEHLGIPVETDAIANMWLTRKGSEQLAPIAIGSHHDAVPNGGMYDGALGVLMATEIMETFKDNGYITRHPIKLVSFTGEEPNPFNVSTLGSKVLSGRLRKADLEKLKNKNDGSSLNDCIKKIGGDIEKADDALIKPGDIRAFIECHIEQGKRLEKADISSCAVNCIIGIYRENVTIYGESNHAGTTLMAERHDAFLGASEFALAFEEAVNSMNREDVVGTIGYVKVSPNASNIIPGSVELSLELRTVEPELKEEVLDKLTKACEKIEKHRGIKIERKLNLDQREMPMDKQVMDAVKRGIEAQGVKAVDLVSMAGHDAANMQRVTQAGMIFVKSIAGKSHCPEEYSEMKDIAVTANAMLEAVLILDKEMD